MKKMGSKCLLPENSRKKGEQAASVTIDISAMPNYYYVKAFLIESDSFKPLCTSYESPNYTREMQEFSKDG